MLTKLLLKPGIKHFCIAGALRCSAEPSVIDAEFLDFILDDPFRRPQDPGGLALVAAGVLEGVDDDLLFI